MTTSLVTGGAGFIASHVVDELIKMGHKVVVLDDLSGGSKDNLPADWGFREHRTASCNCYFWNIDDDRIDSLFAQHHFHYVFHLAAYAAEGLSHFIRRFNYSNNVVGSMNLINCAVKYGVKCFVFTSSMAVYGSLPVPFTENMTPSPEDPYGISKYAVELDLAAAHKMFGLQYIIFRPHNVYGERQNIGDPYRNVVGIFMNQIMRGEPLTIFGDGTQQRAFSYVGDVAPLIANSVHFQAYGHVFNIGSDDAYSIDDLAELVWTAMGEKRYPVVYMPERNEVRYAYCSHAKAELCFNITTTTPLCEGLVRMAQWAKSVGPRESKPFDGVEVERNLPESWRKLVNA